MVIPDHSKLAPVASLINRFEDGSTEQGQPLIRPRSPGKLTIVQNDAGETILNPGGEQVASKEKVVVSEVVVEEVIAVEKVETANGNGTKHEVVQEQETLVTETE